MSDERTSLSFKKNVCDESRQYKAEDGLTYDEAIGRLLAEVDWIGDESELIQQGKDAEEDAEGQS
jgi:hypothetical protein